MRQIQSKADQQGDLRCIVLLNSQALLDPPANCLLISEPPVLEPELLI